MTHNNQKIQFENHHKVRVIEILFPEGLVVNSRDDILYFKKQWQENLKSWHTPYTGILDLRNFSIPQELENEFVKVLRFFEKFHMKKIVGFKDENSKIPADLFFEVFDSYELACQNTSLSRTGGLSRNIDNLRDRIQIENDFHAHVMEVSFLSDTIFETKSDISILKSKMTNMLRLWHTPYSVLFNCVNIQFSQEAKDAFLPVEKFLKGFFCKEVIGYSPKGEKETYPFATFRSRHVAAGRLESVGAQAGNAANCGSKLK